MIARMLAKQSPKKKTVAIWKAWKPYLFHPPSHQTGEAEVMAEMLCILNTAYTPPPAALEVAMSLQDYAAAALTMAAFTEHAIITLEDDPVQVFDARTPPPSKPDSSARDSPPRHSHS